MTTALGAAARAAAPVPPRGRTRTNPAASTGGAASNAAASAKPAVPEVSGPAEPSDDRNLVADQAVAAQARRAAALAKQQQQFNFFAMEHAELMRERQAIDDMQTAQNKHNDDDLKEWIRQI